MRVRDLGGHIVLLEPEMAWSQDERNDGLSRRKPSERGDIQLNHKESTLFEMCGGVLEARDLRLLGREVGDGIGDEIDEPKRSVHFGPGHIANRYVDHLRAGLPLELVNHRC